jgi:hypothetical protein
VAFHPVNAAAAWLLLPYLAWGHFCCGTQLHRLAPLGVTGHNVRYVLAFGLVGVIAAFIALGIYYGLGDKPNAAPDSVTTPSGSQGEPATGE